jgi:hypothetical protein
MPDQNRPQSDGDRIPPTRARQAVVGHQVIVVLALSMMLALAVGAVLLAWF